MATTSRDQVMTNLESWWPGLPILPTWVDPIATAISVMAAALLASAGLIKLFGVRLYPPETSASSSDNFWDGWWREELQIAYPPVLDRHPNWLIRDFFADGTDHYIHAERGIPAKAEQYRDVQVNRLQALRIWPKAGDEQETKPTSNS
jgi:hypothetical protein